MLVNVASVDFFADTGLTGEKNGRRGSRYTPRKSKRFDGLGILYDEVIVLMRIGKSKE